MEAKDEAYKQVKMETSPIRMPKLCMEKEPHVEALDLSMKIRRRSLRLSAPDGGHGSNKAHVDNDPPPPILIQQHKLEKVGDNENLRDLTNDRDLLRNDIEDSNLSKQDDNNLRRDKSRGNIKVQNKVNKNSPPQQEKKKIRQRLNNLECYKRADRVKRAKIPANLNKTLKEKRGNKNDPDPELRARLWASQFTKAVTKAGTSVLNGKIIPEDAFGSMRIRKLTSKKKPLVYPASPQKKKPLVCTASPQKKKPLVCPASQQKKKPLVCPASPQKKKPLVFPASPQKKKRLFPSVMSRDRKKCVIQSKKLIRVPSVAARQQGSKRKRASSSSQSRDTKRSQISKPSSFSKRSNGKHANLKKVEDKPAATVSTSRTRTPRLARVTAELRIKEGVHDDFVLRTKSVAIPQIPKSSEETCSTLGNSTLPVFHDTSSDEPSNSTGLDLKDASETKSTNEPEKPLVLTDENGVSIQSDVSCPLCHAAFKHKKSLLSHLKRKSCLNAKTCSKLENEQPVTCTLCKGIFKRRKYLLRHVIWKRCVKLKPKPIAAKTPKPAPVPNRNPLPGKNAKKPFQCNLCPAGYTRQYNLENHKKNAHPVKKQLCSKPEPQVNSLVVTCDSVNGVGLRDEGNPQSNPSDVVVELDDYNQEDEKENSDYSESGEEDASQEKQCLMRVPVPSYIPQIGSEPTRKGIVRLNHPDGNYPVEIEEELILHFIHHPLPLPIEIKTTNGQVNLQKLQKEIKIVMEIQNDEDKEKEKLPVEPKQQKGQEKEFKHMSKRVDILEEVKKLDPEMICDLPEKIRLLKLKLGRYYNNDFDHEPTSKELKVQKVEVQEDEDAKTKAEHSLITKVLLDPKENDNKEEFQEAVFERSITVTLTKNASNEVKDISAPTFTILENSALLQALN